MPLLHATQLPLWTPMTLIYFEYRRSSFSSASTAPTNSLPKAKSPPSTAWTTIPSSARAKNPPLPAKAGSAIFSSSRSRRRAPSQPCRSEVLPSPAFGLVAVSFRLSWLICFVFTRFAGRMPRTPSRGTMGIRTAGRAVLGTTKAWVLIIFVPFCFIPALLGEGRGVGVVDTYDNAGGGPARNPSIFPLLLFKKKPMRLFQSPSAPPFLSLLSFSITTRPRESLVWGPPDRFISLLSIHPPQIYKYINKTELLPDPGLHFLALPIHSRGRESVRDIEI